MAKIELKEKQELSGKIYYQLWVNDTCELCFGEHEKSAAYNMYDTYLKKALEGYPKITILRSQII
jgi:hypothetical protein